MIQPTLLILAAGMGSRYKGLKQIDTFGPSGETILEYSVYDAIRAGFGKIVFVIRRDIEEPFKRIFIDKLASKIEVDYVFQELDHLPAGFAKPADRQKPWGTGHAVLVAAEKVTTPFAVINADDFYGASSFKVIADYLRQTNNAPTELSMVGYQLVNTLSEYGTVSRGICQADADSFLLSITERTKIGQGADGIFYEENQERVELSPDAIASMNLMGFPSSVFAHFKSQFEAFLGLHGQELTKEFFLPSVVNQLLQTEQARMKVLHSAEKWFGITYPDDKVMAVERLRELINAGVYPNNLWA